MKLNTIFYLFTILCIQLVFSSPYIIPSTEICSKVISFKEESIYNFSVIHNQSGIDNFTWTDNYFYESNFNHSIPLNFFNESNLKIKLIVKKGGYYDSNPLILNSSNNYTYKENECFINHTFNLTPIQENTVDSIIKNTTIDLENSTFINGEEEDNIFSIISISILLLIIGIFMFFKTRKKFY